MEEFLHIFTKPTFVTIAWFCTVISCIYAFIQKSNLTKITQKFDILRVENNNLQQKFESLEISHNALQIQNTNLEQKIVKIEKNDIHDNYQEVHQNGQNNFNQGVIKGDFNYTK